MALTVTLINDFEATMGSMRVKVADVTFDSSYPSGGETIEKAAVGLRAKIQCAQVVGGNAVAGAYLCHYDHANGKLMLFYPTGGGAASPAALADPISTTPALAHDTDDTTTVTAAAADQPTHSAAAGTVTPGRGKELLATTDASTITFRLMFFGR